MFFNSMVEAATNKVCRQVPQCIYIQSGILSFCMDKEYSQCTVWFE